MNIVRIVCWKMRVSVLSKLTPKHTLFCQSKSLFVTEPIPFSAIQRIFFSFQYTGKKDRTMATTGAHCTIECSDQPLDISFHPTVPHVVAAGLVDGTVEVHDFEEQIGSGKQFASAHSNDDEDDDEADTIVSSTAVHTQMMPSKTSESGMRKAVCRALQFSQDGSTLYTGGSGGDLVGLDAARVSTFHAASKTPILWRCPNATYGKAGLQVIHEFKQTTVSASGELAEEDLTQNFRTLLATGDESGGVRIWDTRLLNRETMNQASINSASLKRPPGCVHSWKVHDDYISGFVNSEDGYTLLASSADCTMSAYDLRMATQQNQPLENIVKRSDDQEDELLSIQLMKRGKKVVCGTAEGVLSIFSWGTWGDVSDRFPGHPASVDALLPVDQETLLTGSSDGLIRVVQIHPNKLLGILGDHEGFPIEKLKFNSDKNFVGSVTHDNIVRIWDARILQEDFEHDMDTSELVQDLGADGQVDATALLDKSAKTAENSDEEWEDMDEEMGEDDDEDDSDSDSDEDNGKPKTKNDRRKNRLKSEQERFYDDL